MQTLFSAPYLTIYLHEGSHPALELSWQGYAVGQQFREAALQALALATEHHVTGWVSDDRLLGAVRPRDLDWAAEAIVAPLATLGLRRFAQLESQDALNRRTIDGMYQQVMPQQSFSVQRFDNLESARAWALGN